MRNFYSIFSKDLSQVVQLFEIYFTMNFLSLTGFRIKADSKGGNVLSIIEGKYACVFPSIRRY